MENLQNEMLTGAENQGKITDEKKFTQEELDKIITKRLAKEKNKLESEFKSKIDEEIKLAKMSEEERQKTLFEKERKKFEEEKAKFEKDRLFVQAQRELLKNNIPESMAKFLIGNSEEETKSNIEEFKKISFEDVIQSEINKKLGQSEYMPPTGVATSSDDPFLRAFKR